MTVFQANDGSSMSWASEWRFVVVVVVCAMVRRTLVEKAFVVFVVVAKSPSRQAVNASRFCFQHDGERFVVIILQ